MRVPEAARTLKRRLPRWTAAFQGRSKRFSGGLVLGLLGCALAAPSLRAQDWTMFQGDPQHSGSTPSPIALPLSLSWRYATLRPIPGVNPASPIVVNSLESEPVGFFAARDLIASIRMDSGEARWFYPQRGQLGSGKAATVRTTPLYSNGVVYVGATDGDLYALQANTGDLLWQFPGQNGITASPILINGEIFFGTDNGSIIGLNAKTGKPLIGTGELFKAEDSVVGALTYADGILYFFSRDQNFYAVDLSRALAPQEGRHARRVVRWTYNLTAPPSFASPVIMNDLLYLVDGDTVVAMTASRGRRRWVFQADRAIADTPAVTPQGIFFGTREGTFYGIDLTGHQVWKTEIAGPSYSSPVVARVSVAGQAPRLGTGATASPTARYAVFVGSNRGFIYAFDTGSVNPDDGGKPLWIYKIRPLDPASSTTINVIATPIILSNSLYILADDGSLLSFTPGSVDRTAPLLWGELPDRTGELSGRPPITYAINLADDGSGINPDSINMTVDGQKVDFTYDEYRGIIYYKVAASKAGSREPVQPLSNGRHNVHVDVTDWKGNKAAKDWTFPVNNNIGDVRPTLGAPPSGG